MDKELVEVFTALIAALAAFLAAQARIAARSSEKAAKSTDDAVNHRHDSGNPRIYDIALENRDAIQAALGRLERIEVILKNCPYAPEEVRCEVDPK